MLHTRGLKDQHVDAHGCLAVHCAAQAGQREAALYLIKAMGASMDQADGKGFTPLMHACSVGHAQLVEALIARGANSMHAAADTGVVVLSISFRQTFWLAGPFLRLCCL